VVETAATADLSKTATIVKKSMTGLDPSNHYV
jgi:hypothetical protein